MNSCSTPKSPEISTPDTDLALPTQLSKNPTPYSEFLLHTLVARNVDPNTDLALPTQPSKNPIPYSEFWWKSLSAEILWAHGVQFALDDLSVNMMKIS